MIDSASQYTWVTNAANWNINGSILPVRDIRANGSSMLLRNEDVAYIYEAFREKTQDYLDSYTDHFSRTVEHILHGSELHSVVQTLLNGFIFANSRNQNRTFVKQAYSFTDPSSIIIEYTGSNTAPSRTLNDLYPDCWMEVDYMTASEYSKLTRLYRKLLKGDLMRKVFYFLKQSDWMTTIGNSATCTATYMHCDLEKLQQGQTSLIADDYSSTTHTTNLPTYTLGTLYYSAVQKGIVYERWYDNIDWCVTVRGKFKSLKVLVRDVMSGNLEDTTGVRTEIRKVSFRLIDMQKADNTGYVWRIPSRYIDGAALKQRAIACGYTQLSNMGVGYITNTPANVYSPKMSCQCQIVQYVGELDAKTTLQDVNWTWTP